MSPLAVMTFDRLSGPSSSAQKQVVSLLPKLILFVLVLIVLWLLAKVTWNLVSLYMDRNTTVPFDVSGYQKSAAVQSTDWEKAELFGHYQPAAKKLPKIDNQPKKPPPKRSLLDKFDMTVVGLVVSTNPKNSTAVVKVKGIHMNLVLGQGENVKPGIKIKAIEPTAVIVTDDIKDKRFDYVVDMKKTAKGELKSPPAALASTKPSSTKVVDVKIKDQRSINKINDIKDKLNSNPLGLVSLIRSSPVTRGGQTIGFRYRSSRDPSLFRKMGLRRGDIILAVNGISVADTSQIQSAINSVSSLASTEVLIERGGKQRTLNISVGQ